MKEHGPFNAQDTINEINIGEKKRLEAEESGFKLKANFLLEVCGKVDEDYIISEIDKIIEKYPKLIGNIINDINSKIEELKKQKDEGGDSQDLKNSSLNRLKQHLSSKLES